MGNGKDRNGEMVLVQQHTYTCRYYEVLLREGYVARAAGLNAETRGGGAEQRAPGRRKVLEIKA